MIENPPLLTIHRGHGRPNRALLEAFRRRTDLASGRRHGGGAVRWTGKSSRSILALGQCAPGAGPALTADSYPADVFGMIGAAMEAEPGDVIMCANEGYTGTAVIGDLAAGMMRNKGVAAFVTDGLARDRAGIMAVGLPLFAKGISPNSPASSGPGQVGAPVMLGGVQVSSGDIVVGDADGVVVVPLAIAETVLEKLGQVRAAEKSAENSVKAGSTSLASWHEIHRRARIIQS